MQKPTLIYAYDPLCGWCFGFHPVMEKLEQRFRDQLDFRVIPGGLATDENAQTIREGYSYITDGLKQVELTTGVSFGENFKLLAEEGSYMYDSEPACIAQTVVNNLNSGASLRFAGLMQNALFVEGRDLNELSTFIQIMEESGLEIDPEQFTEQFRDQYTARQTRQHFAWCRKTGATAFPTLLLEIGDETGLLSRGYRPYDTIESHLHHLIRNYEKLLS